MDQNQCMIALERLMDEFFNHSTSNERKRDIEQELQTFKSTPEAWMLCSHFIVNSSSHYVVMFSLSVLESVIHKFDNSYLNIRNEIRQILQNYLYNSGIHAPHYLREKYAKLLVDIAKKDWPHQYPEFIDLIVELLKVTENKVLIGLILLRTTSEEFTNDDSITDKDRRDELARLLEPHIPTFLTILAKILESLENKPRHTATATPPPSPTHSCLGIDSGAHLAAPLDPYSPDNNTLTREVLNTLQHLFTWVPITTITSDIIKCIFNVMNITSYSQEDMDLCMLALSTINEVLYRKCCPRGTEQVFIQLYYHTVDLLKDLSTSSIYQLESIDSLFVQKLSELIVLLIQQHFWKLEIFADVPMLDFLSLFYQFTVQLPSAQCYYQCLTTWMAFVKNIKRQDSHRYLEVLHGLLSMLLQKLQYTTNYEQLKNVDNQDVNDDNETEWALFVKSSNEIIARIGEFAPIDTFNQVFQCWNVHHETYTTLMTELSQNSNLNRLLVSVEERDKLCCILTDFCTLTQTLARLSSLFTDNGKEEIPKHMEEFLERLFQNLVTCVSRAHSGYVFCHNVDPKLRDCLLMVYSELLASLRTWLFWMLQKQKLNQQHLSVLIEITIVLLAKPEDTPESLGYSAACLLNSITDQVPPFQVLEFKTVVDFMSRASVMRHPSVNIRNLIDECVLNMCLNDFGKPGPTGEHLKEFRNFQIGKYLTNLTKDLVYLRHEATEDKRATVCSVFDSLCHIVDYCRKFSAKARLMVYLSVKTVCSKTMSLVHIFANCSDLSQRIMNFFLCIFDVMPQQMGLEGMKEALDGFLMEESNLSNVAHAEKLLQILKLAVEVPGSSYKILLPKILELSLDNLYCVVVKHNKEHPELYLALLQLLYSILAHRWQYFHQSQVRAGFSPCVEGEAAVGPQKPQELVRICEIFGQALQQDDINIPKFSIGALEDLDQKWSLYSKDIFRNHLLVKFLSVLLGALLNKAYSLLSEEVQTAIYHMALRNYQVFFDTFLPQFVSSLQGLTPSQGQELLQSFKQEKDMPSFINQLKIFVSRAQSLTSCNSQQAF